MIESHIFKAGKSTFARLLFERHAQGWIFGGVFLFIVAVVLGLLVDYRIFLLAIILVCLVAPAMMMMLYYNYGIKGDNYVNIIDHRVEIGEDSLTLFLKIKEDNEEEEDEGGNERELSKNHEDNPAKEEWRRYDYPFSAFGRYSVGSDYVVFPFIAPRSGFLYLPADAFAEGDFSEAIKRISSGITKEDNLEMNNEK